MALENPRTTSTRERDKDPDSKIGVTLPIRLSQHGYFHQSKTLLEQTISNIKNLLLTVKGERVGQPTFGSDIYSILFENFDNDFTKKLEDAVKDSVSIWLPHVTIKSLIVNASPKTNTVNLSIGFSVVTDPMATESLTLNLRRAQ
jgi:phage baseplate assembly protein W